MTPYRLHTYLDYTRKALINVIGIAGVLLAEGLVPKPYDHYASIGIAVVAAMIHYAVPNAEKPGSVVALDTADDGADDDDAYVPTGSSEDDVVSVEAAPAPATGLVSETSDVDAQRLIAQMVEMFVRAAQAQSEVIPALSHDRPESAYVG